MGVYTVQITLNIDEDKIAEGIERDVYNKVLQNITEKIEKQFFENKYYLGKSEQPINKIIREEVKGIFLDKETEIADSAAKTLADKLIRSKMVKEKVGEVITNSLNE